MQKMYIEKIGFQGLKVHHFKKQLPSLSFTRSTCQSCARTVFLYTKVLLATYWQRFLLLPPSKVVEIIWLDSWHVYNLSNLQTAGVSFPIVVVMT